MFGKTCSSLNYHDSRERSRKILSGHTHISTDEIQRPAQILIDAHPYNINAVKIPAGPSSGYRHSTHHQAQQRCHQHFQQRETAT